MKDTNSNSISGPQKYRSMTKKANSMPIDTAKAKIPINKTLGIISTQRPNGNIVRDGAPDDAPVMPMSDKARGTASNYQPARDQQQGASIKTIKPKFKY